MCFLQNEKLFRRDRIEASLRSNFANTVSPRLVHDWFLSRVTLVISRVTLATLI